MAPRRQAEGIPRLSEKERIVLKLLVGSPHELSGQDLVDRSGGELRPGTVYTTLARMEDDKGLVASHKETTITPPFTVPRRLYKPTGLGARALAAWEAAELRFAEGA
jgi:DNA-binding PadR family transcriptional regulator